MPPQAKPWFRYYSQALNEPKVQRLRPALFKHWINLLSLANVTKPRGNLPPMCDIAYALRLAEDKTAEAVEELVVLKLIDTIPDGFRLHDWDEWQYQSDARETAGRQGIRGGSAAEAPHNGGGIAAEARRKRGEHAANTPPRSETETEAETEQSRGETREVALPPGRRVTPELIAAMQEEYPTLNVPREAASFRDYNLSKGRRLKDENAGFRHWCRNEVKYAEQRTTARRGAPERPANAAPGPFAFLGV